MLEFNKNIQEVISSQETVKKAHAFTEYNSQKKLFDAGVLTEEQKSYIRQLKGTFTFNLHTANRYLVVTMYYSRDKKYGFLVVDLETLQCAECDSVKNAKKAVLEIVANQPAETVETEQAVEAEETVETENETVETEEKPAKKSGRKSGKNNK